MEDIEVIICSFEFEKAPFVVNHDEELVCSMCGGQPIDYWFISVEAGLKVRLCEKCAEDNML